MGRLWLHASLPDECIPKELLYGELSDGKSSVGGQKKHFKYTFKASLTSPYTLTLVSEKRLLKPIQSDIILSKRAVI